MAYMRKEWKDGDLITLERLNNMEEGISASQKEHAKTVDLPPGTYGGLDTSNSTYKIPSITVDNNGRVANVSQSVLGFASSKSPGILSAQDYHNFITSIVKYQHGTLSYYEEPLGIGVSNAAVIYANGEPIPRILNVLLKIYIDANKSNKYWVSVPYRTKAGKDSKGILYRHAYFEIPQEYAEFNRVEDETMGYMHECEYLVEYIAA